MSDTSPPSVAEPEAPGGAPGKTLSEAARRALAEAAERRATAAAVQTATHEKGGPVGPEPTRYGDWERQGRRHRLLLTCRGLRPRS